MIDAALTAGLRWIRHGVMESDCMRKQTCMEMETSGDIRRTNGTAQWID
jgi:hypothetical protein